MSGRPLLSSVGYRNAEGKLTSDYLRLTSGLPVPSYSENPEAGAAARWMQIPGVAVPCEALRAPRIRLAPGESIVRNNLLHHLQLKGEDRYSDLATEATTLTPLNLSGQNLGCPAQQQALRTMLATNPTAATVSLADNALTDLSDITLPLATSVYLCNNAFASFTKFPRMPVVEKLSVSGNPLRTLNGLSKESFPRLKTLVLDRCPVADDMTTVCAAVLARHNGVKWLGVYGKVVPCIAAPGS